MSILTDHATPGGPTAAGGDDPLLVAQGVSKRFGATLALDEVSVDVRAGEIHCLLGENGAGKSTLGKVLAGLVAADEGMIRLRGGAARIRSVAEARELGIGMVFQELSLANDLTVAENICLGTERGLRARKARERAACRALLDDLGFQVDPDARVGTLSTANKQLVEIAKALYRAPEIVVLDEPTAMLGAAEKARLFSVISRLKAAGKAFVFVTHHIEEVLEVGDRVTIMRDGRAVESFPLTAGITEALIVEKLAGRKLGPPAAKPSLATGAPPVLQVRGLAARGDGPGEILVRRGEIVGLYGVVGCGREAVAAAVAGLEPLSQGELLLNDRAFRPRTPAQAVRAGVAYLPAGRADNCLLPSLSIRENLTVNRLQPFARLGLLRRGVERRHAAAQLSALRVKFADAELPITTLSGGNQQKVLLGRALGSARHLLVLEDPTAGVDVGAKQELHDVIRRRVEAEGLAVLLLSSDLDETLGLCHSVYTVFKNSLVRRYAPADASLHEAVIADVLGNAPRAVPSVH